MGCQKTLFFGLVEVSDAGLVQETFWFLRILAYNLDHA